MNSGDRDWQWIFGATALALAAAAFTLPSSPLCAFATRDEKVPMKDVPEAVRATAGKQFGALDDCTASREKEHGKLRWEIERKVEGGVASLILSDAGDLMEVEKPVDVATLPKSVRDAVALAFPKASVVTAETLETHQYEFTLSVDGKKQHVKVELDGAIELPHAAKAPDAKEHAPKAAPAKKGGAEDEDDDDDDDDEGGK